MNVEMAYLIGMILGNGEIQKGPTHTIVTIDIPYKNLYTDDLKDVAIYVKASTVDMRSIIEPLIGHAVGGVCPFAINENVKVYLDESLKRFTNKRTAAQLPAAVLFCCPGQELI